ncbi:MAG: hypothetical protein GQ557_02595, partial [Mycoplasmataceae bacterium]|nr:hypothetical protein [Mycoplasmataceae bacterium]
MAERFFAKNVGLRNAGTFMTDLQDNKGVLKATITTTAVSSTHLVYTYYNDIPELADASGTVSYEFGASAPEYVTESNTSTFVTISDGDSSTGYLLVANDNAEDMDTVGTFDIIFTVTDASGNESDPLAITFTIVDTTIPVITLTSTTDNLAIADAPTWTPVTNLVSATDDYDGDVSATVVYVYKEDTSGGSVISSLADARTHLGTATN